MPTRFDMRRPVRSNVAPATGERQEPCPDRSPTDSVQTVTSTPAAQVRISAMRRVLLARAAPCDSSNAHNGSCGTDDPWSGSERRRELTQPFGRLGWRGGTRRRGGPPPGAAHDRSVNPEVPTGGSLESLEQFTVSWYLHRHWRIRCKVFHKRQSSTVNQNSPFRKERATRPAPLFWLSDCLITRAAIRTGRRANAEGEVGRARGRGRDGRARPPLRALLSRRIGGSSAGAGEARGAREG
jgi:hypothetical protein